jgi:hypothetical protein
VPPFQACGLESFVIEESSISFRKFFVTSIERVEHMRRKSFLPLLLVATLASIIVSSIAIPNATYTWEKTFEVKKPDVQCQIVVGECRIVGYPVKIWITLKLAGCGDYDCHDDDCSDNCRKNCTSPVACHLNGTYSAQLQWLNETSQEWQHVMYLETGKNITLTCKKHIETYAFTPMWEGKYKVVVTFTTSEGTSTFESDD